MVEYYLVGRFGVRGPYNRLEVESVKLAVSRYTLYPGTVCTRAVLTNEQLEYATKEVHNPWEY